MNAKKALQKWLKGCKKHGASEDGISVWVRFVLEAINDDATISEKQLGFATRLLGKDYLINTSPKLMV